MTRIYFVIFLVIGALSTSLSAAELKELAGDCEACHGLRGVSTESDIPTIAGMSALYLTDSMLAYKDTARPCPEIEYRSGSRKGEKTDMCQLTGPLSEDEIEALSQYFSEQKFVSARQPFDPVKAERGEKVHDLLCEKCHADGGRDPEDDAGIMAGQWAHYLQATMADYRSGDRPMIDKMKIKFEKLGEEDIEALIHFYASHQ